MKAPTDEEVKQMQLMERHYKRKLLVLKCNALPQNSKLPGPPPTPVFLSNIREEGMRTPILVAANADDSWDILDGNRRVKAARLLQWDQIEALQYLGLDDPIERARFKIACNKFRSDNPMQAALLIAELAKAGRTEREIAEALGLTTSEIRRLGPLTGLPKPIQKGLHNGNVALGTALAIVKLAPARQEKLAAKLGSQDKLTGADVAEARQVDVEANVAALALGPMEYEPEPEMFGVCLNGAWCVATPISADELAAYQKAHSGKFEYFRLVKV
jgi:ParB/RepB/Spo0J family partition protein